ncbi:hypothetical protein ACFWFF_34850 [Streptomyces sp. NPDC060223]|uniref:hypothetical protein n=1 Tax=unclassified Streptomyces TaxID=2593676 RepID=UPI0036414D77
MGAAGRAVSPPASDTMVEIIRADTGNYRSLWPPVTEELIKQVQHDALIRTV